MKLRSSPKRDNDLWLQAECDGRTIRPTRKSGHCVLQVIVRYTRREQLQDGRCSRQHCSECRRRSIRFKCGGGDGALAALVECLPCHEVQVHQLCHFTTSSPAALNYCASGPATLCQGNTLSWRRALHPLRRLHSLRSPAAAPAPSRRCRARHSGHLLTAHSPSALSQSVPPGHPSFRRQRASRACESESSLSPTRPSPAK
jgi:hypothetical protein